MTFEIEREWWVHHRWAPWPYVIVRYYRIDTRYRCVSIEIGWLRGSVFFRWQWPQHNPLKRR